MVCEYVNTAILRGVGTVANTYRHLVSVDGIEVMETLHFRRYLARRILITPVVQQALEHSIWAQFGFFSQSAEYR